MANIKLLASYILISSFLIMLFLPGLVSGEADYTAKYLENYTIIFGCDIQGVPCNPAITQCNISLRNPNNEYIFLQDNASLLANGDASIEINGSALSEIGVYRGKAICIQGSANETKSFILETTSSGENRGYGFFLILSISGILIFILGMEQENFWLGFLSGVLLIGAGMYSMIYGIGNIADLYSRMIAVSMLAMGMIIEASAGYSAFQESGVAFS